MRFLLLPILLIGSLPAWSQDTQTYHFGIPVSAVRNTDNKNYTITIDRGHAIGISPKQEVDIWGIRRADVPDHNIRLGAGTITAVTENQATIQGTSEKPIYAGDLVFLEITVPAVEHSPFFYLMANHTILINEQSKPYYTFEEILEKDGLRLRTEKFIAMQMDINAAGEKMKQAGDLSKVEAGPQAGKLVAEALRQTDTLAVWYFAYHLSQIKMETMGQTIGLIEGYKKYAAEGDAISPGLLKSLFTESAPEKREELFRQYKRKINRDLVEDWKKEAKELKEQENYTGAASLLSICIFLAEKMGNVNDAGVYNYQMAENLEKNQEYESAIKAYEKSAEYFMQDKDEEFLGYSYNSLGSVYQKIKQYEDALNFYKKATEVRTELVKKNPGQQVYLNALYTTCDWAASATLEMKDYEASLKLYETGLTVARQAKNKDNEGSALWNLGYVTEQGFGKREEAITYYEQSFNIYMELQDTASALTLRKNVAINYKSLGHYKRADEEIEKGLQLARNWGKPGRMAILLEYRGDVLFDNREYAGAIKAFQEAEALFRQGGDPSSQEKVRKKLGKSYRDAGQYDRAIATHKERFPLLEPSNLSRQADVYWDIAYTYGEKGDHSASVTNYREAEKRYQQLKDTANLTTVINNIGYEYRDLKDSVNAYKEHLRAIRINRFRTDKYDLAYSQEHLAETYKSFKNNAKAAEQFDLASKNYQLTGDWKKAGNMMDGKGNRLSELGKYRMSAEAFRAARDLYQKSGDKKEEAEAIWDYAYQIGQNLKQHEEAIRNYQVAYDLYMEERDSVNASTMLSNIGQNYWSLLDYDKAIESHKLAIALAEKCRNKKQIASSWSKLADLYTESGNPIEGKNALSNAAEALKAINDSTQLASTYEKLGASYQKSKDYLKAHDYYNQSIAIYKLLKDTSMWAYVLYDIAYAYHEKYDYPNANKNFTQSLDLRRKIGDIDGQIYCLSGLGNLELNVTNNYRKAEGYFQQSIKLSDQYNDNNLAYVYGQMKYLYRAEGKAALADEYLQKSIDAYRKTQNWVQMANAIVAQSSDASYVYGDQRKALRLLNNAQAAADTLKDVPLQAYIYSQRATVLREMGEFKKALEFAGRSFEMYRKIDNEWGMAGVFIDQGNIYKQLSEYDLALSNQLKADSLYKKMNSEYARLAPLANIGENYSAMGNYLKGLEYYQQSLAIMEKAGDQNENLAILQGLMGEAYFYLDQFSESDIWLKKSLVTCDKVGAMRPKADNLSVIGRLKLEEKKYEEAHTYLSEGVKLAKEKSMNIAYLNNLVLLGRLEVEQKKYETARPLLEECIALSRDMNKQNTLWEALYWLGVHYKANGQLEKGKDYLKESVAVIEKIRNKVSGGEEAKKLFSKDKNIMKVYEALVDVLLQLNLTEEALSYIQKNNEDNLKAKVKGLEVKFQDENKQRAIVQERDMKAKLDGIEEQIAMEKAMPMEMQNLEKLKNLEGIKTVAEGDYLKFVNMQVNLKPELSSYFNTSIKPADLKGRKRNIPKDMALLSYMPGETQLYIFVATTDTVIAKVVNVSREQLGKNINAMLNIVRTSQGDFQKVDLQNEEARRREIVPEVKLTDKNLHPFEEMYHYLIAPASVEIASKKRLCIIPNGALSYVPFQLLGKTLSSGHFSLMVEQFSIFYSNSTDMLLRAIESDNREFNILAFGNPDRTLPSTEKEVADIKELFPTAAVYLREEATEDKAKHAGENYNVLHFATHGNLDYEDFSKSYLTLAPGKTEDGMLTLEELWGMDVMSHLNIVVLSACQTAVTKGSNERSPVSPASGFLQNGVKSVVATLWKVDDEATSILMTDFYKNMKTMEAVDALRTAQVNLSNHPKFSHPYYWAAAILLGDWR